VQQENFLLPVFCSKRTNFIKGFCEQSHEKIPEFPESGKGKPTLAQFLIE
jgi:hypothetical protein